MEQNGIQAGMIVGQYYGTIGKKNRCALPKKFRDALGEKIIITRGFESSLIVVSENLWKMLLEGTEGLPFTSSSVRDTQRFLLGNAAEIMLDEKGRFILPEHLKNYAGIESSVIYLGVSRYVEIWSKEQWDSYNKELTKNISTIADKLSRKNE